MGGWNKEGFNSSFGIEWLPPDYWRIDIALSRDDPISKNTLLTRAKEDPYLYYPFEIPNGTSYSCASETYSSYSLLGESVNGSYVGPVLQFMGIQVGWGQRDLSGISIPSTV